MRKQEEYIEDVYQYYKETLEKKNEKMQDLKYVKLLKYKNIFVLTVKAILIALIVVICCFIFSCLFKAMSVLKEKVTVEVTNQVRLQYRGNFTVVDTKNEKETFDGEYKVKDDNDIVFTVYKERGNNVNDYDEYLIQKYVSEYVSKKSIDGLVSEEQSRTQNGVTFFKYVYGKRIENFSKIDDAVIELIDLNEYIRKQSSKILKKGYLTLQANIYIGDFSCSIDKYDKKYMEQCQYKVKCNYVEYAHNNNVDDEYLSEYSYKEYYRPSSININVNGIATETTADYQYDKKIYYFNFVDIVNYIPVIESVTRSDNGGITSMVYKEKEYYFGTNKLEFEGDNVPYTWTTDLLEDFFDVEIEFDYDNKLLNFNFKSLEQK